MHKSNQNKQTKMHCFIQTRRLPFFCTTSAQARNSCSSTALHHQTSLCVKLTQVFKNATFFSAKSSIHYYLPSCWQHNHQQVELCLKSNNTVAWHNNEDENGFTKTMKNTLPLWVLPGSLWFSFNWTGQRGYQCHDTLRNGLCYQK